MDYDSFKTEVLKLTSINLSLYKEKQMKRRIDSIIKKNGFTHYRDYIEALKVNTGLLNEFIDYITINVSEFYRNPEQWEVLEKDILPVLLAKTRDLKIWSSACSTGDEPYTLVMVLNKYLPLKNIKIIATDIDNRALEKAKAGIYSYRNLERMPEDYIRSYFIKHQDNYMIKDEVKKCVHFMRHDLLNDKYPNACDLIVCRNVLIYFTEEAKNMVYTKFNMALKTGGVLFVGSTEQIIMSQKYNFSPLRTFFYVKTGDLSG